MTLFSENGFRGTSITQIETAAGLTPGAGGIYHHFKTKEALLTAGIERHLLRLQSLRDIRAVLSGVGDLRVELTLTARYVLAELDRERELLRVLALESRHSPDLTSRVREQLVVASFEGFASWLHTAARVDADRAQAISAVGLGALMSNRLLVALELLPAALVRDDVFVAAWVAMMLNAIGQSLD